MWKASIPASSGNMGVGFDCAGLAIAIHNCIDFEARESGLIIEQNEPTPYIPCNEKNMIFRAAKYTADKLGRELPGLYLKQYNAIPYTRGMGSSAACSVGGILIANTVLNAKLNKDEILEIATELEGHPDNAAPAIFGGACVSAKHAGGILTRFIPIREDLALCLAIPAFTLSTKKARSVLPKQVSTADAVSNISRMGLLISSLYSGDYSALRIALDDKLHQPYRKNLISHFDDVVRAFYDCGAYGACLSGAGPTILAFINRADRGFAERVAQKVKSLPERWEIISSDFDRSGATVQEI